MTPRSPSEWRTSPLALKPLTAILCLFVGLMATLLTPRASPSSTRLLHYAPLLPRVCSPPTWVRARSRVRAGCILVEDVRFADVVLRVSPGVLEQGSSWIIELSLASAGAKMTPVKVWEIKGGGVVEGLVHNASGLLPDSDYGVQVGVRELGAARADVICRTKFVTRPDARNFVINPGFEKVGDPPYAATRFRSGDPSSPRQWTPFYNGGVRVVCGSVPISDSEVVTARSGECCAQFGHRRVEMWTDDIQKYFGAHQAIPIHGNTTTDMLVGAWYRVSSDLAPSALSDATSVTDALAMIVSWQLDDGSVHDGVIVPLDPGGPAAKQWTFSCIIVKPPTGRRFQMIHIYFHRHDYAEGSLFVDDVVARPFHIDEPKDDLHSECPSHHLLQVPPSSHKKTGVEFGVRSSPPERHLRSLVRPQNGQLTLAVPLTADRVLRLEAMSRLYGGGPIAAAVLVQDDSEALRFTRIWRRKPWLLYHVDVTLVYIPAEERTQGRIPINAIRNIAVHLATTEFVVMLDVDMTPSTDTFACFRDPNGTWLEGMLPRGSGRVGALPVFITDVQHRPASSRSELLNQLNTRVGSTYCLNSQKPNKVSRWYTASEPYEIRFMTDYEPYGICRRDEHPAYDERFVGYGFNKISWAYGAEAAGWHLFVLSDSFVTHLNHVENDWVQSISVPLYLQTWRRYLAFVAEVAANHVPLKRTLVPPRDW